MNILSHLSFAFFCIFSIIVQDISSQPVKSLIPRGFKKNYSENFNNAKGSHAQKANNLSPTYHAKSGNLFRAAGVAMKKAVVSRSAVQKGLAHGKALRQTIGLSRSSRRGKV